MRRRLVPIAVALFVLAIFWWTREGGPKSPLEQMDSDVQECTANLLAIYQGLRAYDERFGHAPEEPGVAFFAALVASGVWDASDASVRRLTCPGPNAQPVPPGTDFTDLAALRPSSSAYAGRDTEQHPLAEFPSGGADLQALVACDNADDWNHDGVVNVLYSDGTVKSFEADRLREQGVLTDETAPLRVGAGSPLAELATLLGD